MRKLFYFITIGIVFSFTSLRAQWIKTNFTQGGVVSLAVGSHDELFAGVDGAGVFLSVNDGASWVEVNNGLTDKAVRSIAVSDSNIYAGTFGTHYDWYTHGLIFHSTNNGSSWQAFDTSFYGFPKYILLKDSEIFVGFSGQNGGSEIYLSTNRGVSWNMVFSTPSAYTAITSIFASDLYVYAGFYFFHNLFIRSSDNGLTWETIDNTPLGGIEAFALIGNNLFAGTTTGVYLSGDEGLSWIPVNNNLPDYVNNYGWVTSLAVSPDEFGGTNLFAGTDSAGVFLSNDNGTTWASIGMNNIYIYSLVVNSTNLFAVTDSGLWKRSLSEMITDIGDPKVSAPSEFVLQQNYPNPFNPSTKIQYFLPQQFKVSIKIFDALGNEIESLVDEEKPAGIYELNWNAANLPSGVYFYKLTAGSFVETKKMILMK